MATLTANPPTPEELMEGINTRDMQSYTDYRQGGKARQGAGMKGYVHHKMGGPRGMVPDGAYSEDFSSAQSGQDDDGMSSHGAPSPTSPGASANGDGVVDGKLLDKRSRHKKVEQNRREMTRKFTEELHQLTPGTSGTQGTCINAVLEGVLQYLQEGQAVSNKRKRSDTDDYRPEELCLRLSMPAKVRVPRGFTEGMFGGAFESAPMGIIMASTAGQVLRCNSIFFNLFGLDKIEGTPTMFSLTAPTSVPATMQAASALISGQTSNVKLVKRCLRRGGVEDEFQVQMNVVHKQNKPQYFVCYVRHTNTTRPKVEEVPEHSEQYAKQYSNLVCDAPFTGGFIHTMQGHPSEELEDPDLEGFCRARSDPVDRVGSGGGAHNDPLA
jgi:PAS domain-containing protein